MAYMSKGIKLSYKVGTAASGYTDLTDLQEIPDIGGSTESIEITTLADTAHRYMNGIKDYGDSLDFVFLYAPEQFATLNGLQGSINWQVSLPDGENGAIDTVATFSGECSVVLSGVGVNEALTYTLSIKPDSEIIFA